MFPHGVTVTMVRKTVSGVDEFGNDVYAATTADVGPCSVQPTSSRENISFTDQLTDSITVFVPYGTNVSYLDAVIVRGVQYEVNGTPDTWTSPWTGNVAPIRIEATLVKGAEP